MPNTLASRLQRSHMQTFVGRADECALFAQALRAPEPPFVLLHVHGPGGIGKSSLLRQFVWLAGQQAVATYLVNGEEFEPSPAAFLRALGTAIALRDPAAASQAPADYLAHITQRSVLLIDTFEAVAPLASWLRDSFLPALSGEVVVVIADRNPLPVRWRVDPAWQPLIRTLALRNLPPADSQTYLTRHGVPEQTQRAVLRFTQGHPLGLALVAATFAQRPDVEFTPLAQPDIVKALVERFVAEVPSPAHRVAIDVAALVRTLDEALLAHVLQLRDARRIFEWLRELSFIETRARGVAPHNLAREALAADLQWRNPDWHRQLNDRVRDYYRQRLSDGSDQQETLVDYIYLHRNNPIVQPFFEQLQTHSGSGYAAVDALRATDRAALLAMVEKHEGVSAAALAGRWLDAQPHGARVYRDEAGQPVGYMHVLDLGLADPLLRGEDPATAAAWRYLQAHAPLRAGEKAIHVRFWLDGRHYQALSPLQAAVFVQAVRLYLTTPNLAYSFFASGQAQFWLPIFVYADLPPLPAAAFQLDGRDYGVFTHDWRQLPPTQWLDLLAARESQRGGGQTAPPAARPTLVVLSETAFAEAVREAVQAYSQPDRLLENPLLRSRLVLETAGATADDDARVAALRALIDAAAAPLQSDARRVKYYRALYHACIQPAPTHEAAAELIDTPYGSFRRHLRRAIEAITADLWQRELA